MILEINFTYIVILLYLWFYAITNLNNTIAQIDNTTIKKEISNKTRANDFFEHFVDIFFFITMYFTGNLNIFLL